MREGIGKNEMNELEPSVDKPQTQQRKAVMKPFIALSLTIASLLAVPGGVLASDHATGAQSTVNVDINNAANWVVIAKATVSIIPVFDAATHGCVVNASADVYWTGGGVAGVENRYRFTVSRNNTNPLTGLATERTLSTVDQPGVDNPNYYPVSTTGAFLGLTGDNGLNGGGQHTFYLLGRKALVTDPNVIVGDSSLSVVCVDPS
jgi:hypothetical protein